MKSKPSFVSRFGAALAVVGLFSLMGREAKGEDKAPKFAGPVEKGYLLPNGWTITPTGSHVELTDLPLNIIPLPDGRHALVSSNGFNRHQLVVVDLQEKKVVGSDSQRETWFGLTTTPGFDRVWWSGGGGSQVHEYSLKGTALQRLKSWADPAAPPQKGKKTGFRSGLYFDEPGKRLLSLDIEAGKLQAIDPATGKIIASQVVGGRPYDLVFSKNRQRILISDWAGRQVLMLSANDLRVLAKIPVGEHPNQMAAHPKDNRVFVACASSNGVWVIDTLRGIVTETIFTSLFPRAPEGSTPDAVACSPDGEHLAVANADNNCVALVEIEEPNRSVIEGFIPTGWYPSAVSFSKDGKKLLVGVGKGNQFGPNKIPPKDEAEAKTYRPQFKYIGTMVTGALSIIDIPDEKGLAELSAQVYRNCPYADEQLTVAPYDKPTVIPRKVGDPCPITHVIYIIKENRTYDQVLSDIPRGNRDPSLLMFGEEVTPNHHKLANEFVLLDNLYCNGQVSRDGHPWSTMAYNTDYTSRDWMLTYSSREGVDDDDEGNLSRAPSGYLWDAAGRAGLTYRNYGEYGRRVSQPDGTLVMDAAVPGLIGHMCPRYGTRRADGKPMRDPDNVEVFLEEFREYEKNDNLPRLIIMSLGEDHTQGTREGAPTPRACVASNDLALGRLVEAISKSKYWPRIAIFVIEDDAQNGPDHVDAHRTVGLVISPYIKRGMLDSTQYQTVSVIRTMELILGIPPLSQYDAAARPMFACFSDQADTRPYQHVPARIDVNERNTKKSYGAARSAKMDFSEYDRIDDFELNEILWRAVKGADAPLPAPVRRALAHRPQLLAVGK